MLFFSAGLFFQIPTVSAQADDEGALSEEVRDPRAGERDISFSDEDSENDFTPVDISAASTIWPIIRMILVLALAAAAVYGVVFFIKRSSKKKDAEDPFLKVLANVHLGSNRYAHIVSVGDKAWLLGSSDGGVNLIGEIGDKDLINTMLLEDSAKIERAQTRLPDFLGMIRRFGAKAENKVPSVDDIRKRRERLKGL